MNRISRTFHGSPTGDMKGIDTLPVLAAREQFEDFIRCYIADKYSKCPSCDKPKVGEILVDYCPDDEVYPYLVSYLSKEDEKPHLLGSIDIPFYDEKCDIRGGFPTRDIFYQNVALKKYKQALTDNLTGTMLFWFLRSDMDDDISIKLRCLHQEFEYLDDSDILRLYQIAQEYKI